jgi:4-amino-4-deoxy-L-arabinose transferase-like glycosyltransferase
MRKAYWWIAVAVIYLAAASGVARTKLPFCDEGYYSNPAFNLASGSSMATTVLETAGHHYRGLEHHTYWEMPLFILAEAGGFKVFGFGLFQMRGLSVVCGLAILVSCFLIVRKLLESDGAALLVCALLATDSEFLTAAPVGRSDALCAALGFAALAVFLCLRERHRGWAVLASQSLTAASGMTHPNGLFYFGGLLLLTLGLDYRRLGWRHVGIATIPYLVGAAAWGAYILQDPADFWVQFWGTGSARLAGIGHLGYALKAEIVNRYLDTYGLALHASMLSRLHVVSLLGYAIGVAGCVLSPGLRRQRGVRLLLCLAGLVFVMMVLLESTKQDWYLIHILPWFAALLGVWVCYVWERRALPHWLLVVGLCGLFMVNLGTVIHLIRRNDYRTRYLAAANFLQSERDGKALVMGDAALGFALGFDNLLDDTRLGYYTGKQAQFIVVESNYEGWFDRFRRSEPEVYRHIQTLLTRAYRKIYDAGSYRIYVRQ